MGRHLWITVGALSAFRRDVLGQFHPGPPGVDLPEGADPLAVWDLLARAGVPEDRRGERSAVEDPDGRGPRLFLQRTVEPPPGGHRLHLDVRAAPGRHGAERMAALDA